MKKKSIYKPIYLRLSLNLSLFPAHTEYIVKF